jgi:hypothetical protein
MKRKITLSDGTVLASSSQRRFVVFSIADDSHVSIVRRSDSLATAIDTGRDHRHRTCRVVVADMVEGRTKYDTADARR